MKKLIASKSFRVLVGILLLLVVYGLGRRGMHRPDPHAGHDHAEVQAESPSGAPQMYTCSMHPQIRTPDKNELCPICAMALIPVPSDGDDAEDDGEVPRLRVSRRAAALMKIQTWPAEHRSIAKDLQVSGSISRDESRVYNVVAKTDAYIETLFANTPWQSVAAGEPLAALYSPAAVTAMRELLVARDAPDVMREAAEARLVRMGLDPEAIQELAKLDDVPRTFQIHSPVSGVIQTLAARQGAWLREGQPLLELVDLSRVWVNLEAYERDHPWLHKGATAVITTAAMPGTSSEGTVTFVDPVVDTRKRTIQLRVEVDNPDHLLKPGMFVSATVHADYPPPGNARLQPGPENATQERGDPSEPSSLPLVVPASAPLVMGRRAIVYVQVPDTDHPTFEPRHVELGPRTDAWWIITSGLRAGEQVVINGQFKIDSELQIRGRTSMMAPEGGSAPAGHQHGDTHGEHATTHLQTECPVMGGAINTDSFVDVDGYRIYVCCPGCDTQIEDDPQKYISEMKQAGIQLYRLQTHCPIMDFPINRELYYDHNGQRIYVCCAGCIDDIKERAEEIITGHRNKGIVFEVTP
jgi:membrane fusion protein, copper/silver efflux system